MTSKQLPAPECYFGSEITWRNWWRFGNGSDAVSVSEGPCSQGHSFACHTDTAKHDCIHIRALERHLGIQDYRNQPARVTETA